uniref:WD repeat-containing protein 34 isoform X1 n=2 Tax=Ciona intestinalis TaxID=7719 RepID=UPI00005250D6|nr:WD repeat-containing protein 34 isoform X1 [Ciona intestinalis]|eukprot:XP_002130222.1 WD repeat-containing protein 34 isoform X1 [Ciona intestinalis]
MFHDYESKTFEFCSFWKTEKRLRDSNSQTSAILTYDVENQTTRPRDAKCQTETFSQLMKSNFTQQDENIDQEKLAKFLSNVEEVVSKQLKINISCNHLYPGSVKHRNANDKSIVCEHVLDEEGVRQEKDNINKEVTCISWSGSGASIAVGFGTNENISWSENKSFVCSWNLDRPKLNPHKCDHKLEVESSVQAVAFHPTLAQYIAVGLFSGVVLVWNIVKDDVIYGESPHEDPVTSLLWFEHQNSKYLRLVSGSTDGKLISWRIRKDKDSNLMKIDQTKKINSKNLPRRAGVKGQTAIGITCLDSPIHDSPLPSSGTAVVGCENGSVIKCSLEGMESNPVTFVYDNHVGPVYSIQWSKFHRNLFITCAMDQLCRIYHALQTNPLREIRIGGSVSNHIYSACWSTTRPCMAYVTSGNDIEVWDVTTPSLILATKLGKPPVTSMRMNPSRPSIATGCSNGVVQILKLGSCLVHADDVIKEETMALYDITKETINE